MNKISQKIEKLKIKVFDKKIKKICSNLGPIRPAFLNGIREKCALTFYRERWRLPFPMQDSKLDKRLYFSSKFWINGFFQTYFSSLGIDKNDQNYWSLWPTIKENFKHFSSMAFYFRSWKRLEFFLPFSTQAYASYTTSKK